jgi:hypothetical protein
MTGERSLDLNTFKFSSSQHTFRWTEDFWTSKRDWVSLRLVSWLHKGLHIIEEALANLEDSGLLKQVNS